jgi:undecaprenyl diphosphate synthase
MAVIAKKSLTEDVPRHVAIVMDGNRRWAKERGLSILDGHRQGSDRLREVVEAAADQGVQVLTVWAFSTENWKRSKAEVAGLLLLMEQVLEWKCEEMVKLGVRFHTIGDLARLPERLRAKIDEVQQATAHGNRIDLVVGINYGGRDEIRRAVKRAIEQGMDLSTITEEQLSSCMDTAKWGDPDLVIRTGGELRVSNFLLWQCCYSEMFFTPRYWPDFSGHHLGEAIAHYQQRQRRYGQ